MTGKAVSILFGMWGITTLISGIVLVWYDKQRKYNWIGDIAGDVFVACLCIIGSVFFIGVLLFVIVNLWM